MHMVNDCLLSAYALTRLPPDVHQVFRAEVVEVAVYAGTG